MPSPETPSASVAPLSRAEKEKLMQKMYSLPHWIAIIRLFGYQTLAMDRAREAIKPIAEQYGKPDVADACEVLIDIQSSGKDPVARLKPHIRHMAFQILGPVPSSDPPSPAAQAVADSADAKSKGESKPTRPRRPKEPKTQKAPADTTPTPRHGQTLMEQYRAAKERHPDMLLLFRAGDFYELFAEDAEAAHALLGLTLTTRDQTVTMAGFPHHQLESYLHKLLQAGRRVAVCDQIDDEKTVRREVTRVVTPGASEEAKPVKQPRHFVLKKYEEMLGREGVAFVSVNDVKKATPDIAPHVAALDYIVLRGDSKLLVTVRPSLQKKHLTAMAELQKLFGTEYRPVRIWPTYGAGEWIWSEHPIAIRDCL